MSAGASRSPERPRRRAPSITFPLDHQSFSSHRASSGHARTGKPASWRHPQSDQAATLANPDPESLRRSISYSDFYHAFRSRLRKQSPCAKSKKTQSRVGGPVTNGLNATHDASAALTDSSHEKYQLYLDQLGESSRQLQSLNEGASTHIALLNRISGSFKTIDAQSSSFRARCEDLISEQRRLSALADNLSQNLQCYNLLDPMTKRLNAPGAGQFVRGEDFSQMLLNLDQCLEYMETHTNHREATTYRSRYRLLLTRALTLIRVHFTNTLREIAADVSRRIVDRQLNDTTLSALFYAKFRVDAPELKRLGQEIQRRVNPRDAGPEAQGEYQSLMNELYQSYSAARGRLLVPLVRKKLADLAATPNTYKDLIAFARSSISFIRGICLDEFELWHEWFEGDAGLYDFLEAICEPLYDYLRPRTIRETQLQKLCEMCSLIQVRYMDDQDDEDDMIDADQLDFSRLVRPALEDAQTRLVFLTLNYLRDEIERFKPKPSDLEYPKTRPNHDPTDGSKAKAPVLSGRKNSINGLGPQMPQAPTIVDSDGTDAFDLHKRNIAGINYNEWYPTLRKAMWVLGRIYTLVNSTVFDDLAHQVVHQTTVSVQKAATQIASKATAFDSQLFLLKQLLILKQQIVAFDIEYVTPEINFDWSNMTNTFWELRERGGLFNPMNLWRLVGSGLMPQVVENMLDAKVELDGRLRTVINDFTNQFAERMTSPISDKALGRKGMDAAKAVQAVRTSIEREVPTLRAKIDAYLDDARIRETLVEAVQTQALRNYEDFFERYASRADGATTSKKGKGRENDVWDPDTFADWMMDVFGVEPLGFDGDDGEFSTQRSDAGST